jgi:tight adherence protein C
MLDLVTLTIFVCTLCVVWLVTRTLLKPRSSLAMQPGGGYRGLAGAPERSSAWIDSLAAQLPQVFGDDELSKDLRRAGDYRPSARKRFLAIRNSIVILILLATGGVGFYFWPQHPKVFGWTLIIGFVAAVLGFALPRVQLAISAKRRVGRISAALPDALDTISMCLHGGISLQECLGYVGRELMSVHPDIAIELMTVGQQAEMNTFELAIQQFANRIDAPEIVAMAAMVAQNQRLGTGIVDSIREYADNLRLKRRQTAEAKANRAELFLLFPIIFCLMPSILLILWGPPILTLIDFITGPTSPLRIRS